MGLWDEHPRMISGLDQVDYLIKLSVKSNQKIIEKGVNDLLLAGGKRLRPALVLLSGQFGDYNEEKLASLAASIEILHMATLVHDDIIDNSDMRRGQPTVNSIWDNGVAVFTGDFLFSRAFSLITEETSHENLRQLAKVIRGICEGEVAQFEARYKLDSSVKQYLKKISKKTATLFAASCYAGASESGCDKVTKMRLKQYGYCIGMAFQITDDLLDFTGEQAKVGKPLLCDFLEGVYTLPVIYTYSMGKYREELEPFIGKRELSQNEIGHVKYLIKESGGIDYSRGLAQRYLNHAKGYISSLEGTPPKEALLGLADLLIDRTY